MILYTLVAFNSQAYNINYLTRVRTVHPLALEVLQAQHFLLLPLPLPLVQLSHQVIPQLMKVAIFYMLQAKKVKAH